MGNRRTVLGLLVFSLIFVGVGFVLTNSYDFGLCYANFEEHKYDILCINFYERIGDPFYYGMGALTTIFLVLLAVPQAFSAWKKFAIWFVPIAAILFATYSDPSSGDWISPYPEQVFKWVSALYVLISLVVIALYSYRAKRKVK